MSIEHKFTFTTSDGRDLLDQDVWIASLSGDEQHEFAEAVKRQKAYRQVVIDRGDLIIGHDDFGGETHIWSSPEAAEQGKPYDPTWAIYFDRWISENNIIFRIVTI